MSKTVDGICAHHAVISHACRQLRTDGGAFDLAVSRCRVQYEKALEGWRKQGKEPTIHLVLTVERPE